MAAITPTGVIGHQCTKSLKLKAGVVSMVGDRVDYKRDDLTCSITPPPRGASKRTTNLVTDLDLSLLLFHDEGRGGHSGGCKVAPESCDW